MDIKEDLFNNTDFVLTESHATKFGVLAAKIAYYNFAWRFITLVMFNSVQAIGLKSFLMNYNQSVILKFGRFVPKHRVAVPQIVIFGEQASEISSTIQWLVRVNYDNNAKFLIICASHEEECDEHKIFTTLVKFHVVNVILFKSSKSSDEPQVFTYSIATPVKCHNDKPYMLDLRSDCHKDKCLKTLFPEKLSNFYKCRLVISTIEQPPFMYLYNGTETVSGTDGDIVKLAADMLNATLVIEAPRDGYELGHYTINNWTGSLGDIYNNRSMVSVCAAPLTLEKYGNFQISFTYYSMDMVWIAKLPPEKAPWEKLLHPLNRQIRIVLLFTFIAIIFMNTFKDTRMWRKVRTVFRIGPSKSNLLFYSWLIFLGMPILKIPAKRILLLVFFLWIWCCFIIRSAYQAALMHSLKYPTYLDDLESFKDIRKCGFPFGGPAYLRDYYLDDREIYDNWVVLDLDLSYETIENILDGTTDFVMAANKELIKYHLMKYNGTKDLQILPKKIVNSPTVMYLKKFSPLTSPLSYVLRVAFEGGFIQRSYERYLYNNRKMTRGFHAQRRDALNMYHFAGCFAVLIIGWFLSIVYFAVEYICGNINEELE